MKKKHSYAALILLLSLFSCKKDNDEKGPVVTYSSPAESQVYNVYDYVNVAASITDDTKITNVSVSLVDVNHILANAAQEVTVSSPSMALNINYQVDNIHIESGEYFIEIFASDGKHDTHAYRKINIIALPRVLKTVFVTSSTTSAQTNLSKIDSAFTTITPYHVFTGDHIGSSVSSYYQQAYMCGYYTGNFTGIDLNYNTQKFAVNSILSANPYFTGFYNDDITNYVARYDGLIKGYDRNGDPVYGASALTGLYAQHMCFNSDHLIAEEQDKTSSAKTLVTYFPTGAQEKNCSLSQDVVAFCEKDANNVFVFGNNGGQGVIQLYDRLANNLWNPYSFSLATGAILSALNMDADTYLIGHSNGTIYRYQYLSGSVTVYATGYTAIQMKYDNLSNTLYVVETGKVNVLDYSSASFIRSVISTETVSGIDLLYNR